MKLFFTFAFFFIFTGFVNSQHLEFFKEEITFELDSLYFTVNGDYYFRNNCNRMLTPTVTFPVANPGFDKPFDTILVFSQENTGIPLKVMMKDTIARFSINLPPFEVRMFKVIYRQRHNGQMARYILTTTAFWKKPIEQAHFSLVIPEYLKVTGFSILPDTLSRFEKTRIYYWEKANYMPEEDFIVHFKIITN